MPPPTDILLHDEIARVIAIIPITARRFERFWGTIFNDIFMPIQKTKLMAAKPLYALGK
jgi:hypothetical protein